MSTTTTTQASSFTLSSRPSTAFGGPVTAKLNFFAPPADGARPFQVIDGPPGEPESNYGTVAREVQINDMRGREASFDLDTNAFLPVPAPPGPPAPEADFSSDAAIARTYYPEVERLLLAHLPGHPSRAVIFDHTVRRAVADAARGPVQRAHIDQTAASARARVRRHVRADEADRVLALGGERVRLVNVWRPLNGPVESFPLAVADAATVADRRLHDVELRFPDRVGETKGVEHGPEMAWWYLGGMRNDERLLLQCYDSQTGTRVPHTAFEDPRAGEDAKPRESIEIRALVFG